MISPHSAEITNVAFDKLSQPKSPQLVNLNPDSQFSKQ